MNFLTDDPWNPAHRAGWFMESLLEYDHIFNPRLANMDDLRRHGCRKTSYLPFAYSPAVHFPPRENSTSAMLGAIDVAFVGGADLDRIPYIDALIKSGVKLGLYGHYWDRFRLTRKHVAGMASPELMRLVASRAKVSLCLVRRGNRDGHCMRTFELAAMGACILAEHTAEHEEILGQEGEAVLYFSNIVEMVEKVHWLLSRDSVRDELRAQCYERITTRCHQYQDRLRSILSA